MIDSRNFRPNSAQCGQLPWPLEQRPHTTPASTGFLCSSPAAMDPDLGSSYPVEGVKPGVRLPKTLSRTSRPPSSGSLVKKYPLRSPLLPESVGLMVEGLQTGQTVLVESTSRRVASEEIIRRVDEQKDKRQLEALERERKERLKDKATIRRLEQEIKRLKEMVNERDGKIVDLENTVSELERKLLKEKKEVEDDLVVANAKIRSLQDEIQMRMEETKVGLAQFHAMKAEKDSEINKQQQVINELQTTIKNNQSTISSLTQQLEAAHDKNNLLSSQKKDNELNQNKIIQQLKEELAAEKAQTRRLEKELSDKNNGQLSKEASLISLQDKVKQYNTYIQKICQPQFSVVKDINLTPVNPSGFNVVEGHVLVPLVLLLEGYSFLPPEMRDTYNQTDYNPPTTSSLRRKLSKVECVT